MSYILIRDKRRKKLTMSVEKDGSVLIKAPHRVKKSVIDSFYTRNQRWIEQQKQKMQVRSCNYVQLTEQDIEMLKKQAKDVLSQKTQYFADKMNVCYDAVKITSAKKRWGSCVKRNGRYSICYSWRTMLLPQLRQDYIVVHELAHIKQFNHSPDFYKEIEKVLPDWKQRHLQTKNFEDIYLY